VRVDWFDVLAVSGLVILAVGAGMVYVPAGLIVFGVGLIVWATVGAIVNSRGKA